jgi:hypothetical protein
MVYILLAILYLMVGGFIYGCVNNPDLEAVCRFGWPLVVVMYAMAAISTAGEVAGKCLREIVHNSEVEEEV